MDIKFTPEKIAKKIRNKEWDRSFIRDNLTNIKQTLKLNNDTISDADTVSFVLHVVENRLPMHRLKRYYNKCRDFSMERFIEFVNYRGSNVTSHYYYLVYGIYGEEEKHNMLTRRGSPWCPVRYAKKHNISVEEASHHIQDKLKNKSTSLSKFIERHGHDDGTQMYNEWLSKCRQTQDNFKERYGEQADFKWKKHIQNKRNVNPRCLEYWLNKGVAEEQAREKIREFQLNNAGVHLNYLLQNYDTQTAHNIYKQINCKKDSGSLQHFLMRYGDNPLAYAKYHDVCAMKDNVSVKSFMRRGFSQVEAQELHDQAVLKRIPKSYSRESIIFFEQLLSEFKFTADQLFYGEREWFLYNKVNQKFCLYDLTIITEKMKCIVEYHGVAFHPSPKLSGEELESWRSPYSKETAHMISERDKDKRLLAIANGFKYYEVWSDDEQKLDKVRAFLNNNIQ